MKKYRPCLLLVIGLLLFCALPISAQECNSCSCKKTNCPPEGFTALFNGVDLTGWSGAPVNDKPFSEWYLLPIEKRLATSQQWDAEFKSHWKVENGELVNDGKGYYAATNVNYKNFELRIDYKIGPKADSGIYLRGVPQVQIWDFTEAGGSWKHGAAKGSGGLWNNKTQPRHPLELADNPIGQWNSFRITMVGSVVNIWLNGKHIVQDTILENIYDPEGKVPAAGPIILQTHGAEIRWRNIYIKEI